MDTSLTLAKEKRIRKRRDFLRIQNRGNRIFGRFTVIVFLPLFSSKQGKLGITVPKKVGPSHVRNKIKRRIRHIFRHHQELFLKQSVVIIARNSSSVVSFAELETDLLSTWARATPEKNYRFFRASSPKKAA
ncbi:MAG: ribonuclease P protein component [Myxococcales bacterium]|nr:ribonuclease P protein component [Myxococcales bacterium]USN49816.1 MAG: ribonuclease P protein component [Myxococcales bacterium]